MTIFLAGLILTIYGESENFRADFARIWDAETGGCIGQPIRHSVEQEIHSIAMSPAGSRLATGGVDGLLRIWDVRSGAPTTEPLRHTPNSRSGRLWPNDWWGASVFALAFDNNGYLLASGGADGVIRLWHAGEGLLVGELAALPSAIAWLGFGLDGSTLKVMSVDSSTIVIRLPGPIPGTKADLVRWGRNLTQFRLDSVGGVHPLEESYWRNR